MIIRSSPVSSQELLEKLPTSLLRRLEHRRALRYAESLTRNPTALQAWNPTDAHSIADRQRMELLLELILVRIFRTGNGDAESRTVACQRLFQSGWSTPHIAVWIGEKLFYSKVITGGTDIATFWLCVSFSFALPPLVIQDTSEIAHRYLQHAPFALDRNTAHRFVLASIKVNRPRSSRWSLKLSDEWRLQAQHAERARIMLEAIVCVSLRCRSIDQVGNRLDETPPTPLLQSALPRLAELYIRAEVEHRWARDVVKAAVPYANDPLPFFIYLHDTLFDLSYREIYAFVRRHLQDPVRIDALYRTYYEQDHLHVALRTVECELVCRIWPWSRGSIQPCIRQTIREIVAGTSLCDHRTKELMVRFAILVARTQLVSEAAVSLVRRVLVMADLKLPGENERSVRDELEGYLTVAEASSAPTLQHLSLEQTVAHHWPDFAPAERRAIRSALRWQRIQLQKESPFSKELAQRMPGLMLRLEFALEKAAWFVYERWMRSSSSHRVIERIEGALGVPFAFVDHEDLDRLTALARSFARDHQRSAAASGILAGSSGHPIFIFVDGLLNFAIAVRAAATIGACFGIDPRSPQGFAFVLDTLMLRMPTEAEKGFETFLSNQRPRVKRVTFLFAFQIIAKVLNRHLRRQQAITEQPNPKFSIDSPHGPELPQSSLSPVGFVGHPMDLERLHHSLPFLGASINGIVNRNFMRDLTRTALHLGSTRWILMRHDLNVDAGIRDATCFSPQTPANWSPL